MGSSGEENSSGPIEEFPRPKIQLLGEQDGPTERILKEKLFLAFLDFPAIERAYLVQVAYADMSEASGVALCLCPPDGYEMKEVVKIVARIFSTFFNSTCSLDLITASLAQETEIRKVCNPFYDKESAPRT